MKIVFFGTPDYVLPVLKALHKKYVTGPGKSPIVAVVTQSPKPTGRKQILSYSAIDKWAHDHKIATYYQASDMLEDNIEADFGVLAAHGEIITKDVIKMFPQGIMVIHPSLLPQYRGASPIQAAISDGLSTTGVSIIRMDEKIDHGPIIAQFKEDIAPTDTTETLRARLFERSAEVLTDLIEPYIQNKIKPRVQNDEDATYTTKITKENGKIDLTKKTAQESDNFIRAMQPWPIAWTIIDEKRIKLLKSHMENGKLIIDEAQLEGKNPVTWKQLVEGYPKLNFANKEE